MISLKLLSTSNFIKIVAKLDESLGLKTSSFDISFGASDVVVFSYSQEWYAGSGGLHLAIGSFKPVVVSKIPKFEEVPREISNELVFNPKDSSNLATILIKLLVDNNFREIIIDKVKSYALTTSWDLIAKTHIQLYETL